MVGVNSLTCSDVTCVGLCIGSPLSGKEVQNFFRQQAAFSRIHRFHGLLISVRE